MKENNFSVKPQIQAMPLAARMRPRSLEEMVGQEHLLGNNGLLSKLIERKVLPSLILWGPSGSGKTSLAENLCYAVTGKLIRMSAVMAGVKEIREAVLVAEKNQQSDFFAKTYLFVDEIHRFNRAQQDALLPHVESGAITLIGATTENPSFSVNAPLLSRCRVLVLKPLEARHFHELITRALSDSQRGVLSNAVLELKDDARELLVLSSSGDARILLSTLEVAADLAMCAKASAINLQHVQEAAGKRTIAHDKKGDEHYNVISAFIKSMRGSDPDATCHYLVRMIEVGEEPRFILRRMAIFASEDIGNADPQAIQIAAAAFQIFEWVGMPEGYLTLAQTAIYLACAPKSDAVATAYKKAASDVEIFGALPVPLHLCNAPTSMMENMDHSKGYRYSYAYDNNYAKQQYLPDKLVGQDYYVPTQNGYERFIFDRLTKLKNRV
jgi:putative ATPase